MIAWLNFIVMIVFIVAFVLLYIRSVSPARLESRLGEKAYQHCGRIRAISIVILLLILGNYLIYDSSPLPTPGLMEFNWSYLTLVIVAIVIAIPTTYMVIVGMKDAGDEAIQPSKESKMFGGIYDHIRHPQTWEYGYFFVLAFLLNNPFLVLFSLVWLPAMILMIRAEEKDLLIRYGKEYQSYMTRTGRLLPKRKKQVS